MLWTFSKGSDSVQDEESLKVSSKVRLLTQAFHQGSLQKERRGRIQMLSKGSVFSQGGKMKRFIVIL